MIKLQKIVLTSLLAIFGADASAQVATQELLNKIHLPTGFRVSVYAENLPNARSMTLGDKGIVYIGTGKEGKVYAVEPASTTGKPRPHWLIASGLTMPNGVAFQDGSLYVADINKILRFNAIGTQLANPPKPVVIYDQFPTDKHHGWKYLRFGPDGKLYTAVGAPCNNCLPPSDIYTSLVRLNADGSHLEILAQGIRNTVGFDWQPDTKQLFFSDNGRDHLGDDVPPDELNKWTEKGEHFGYPYCHGGEIADPELANGKHCSQFKAPVWKFKAHVAPLGLRFYEGQQFPAYYQKQLFVAQHGSWNRSEPQGYRVALVKFNSEGEPVSEEDFMSGWLQAGSVLGRPVDILALPDGSLLVSDDLQGAIYQVTYQAQSR